MIYCHKFRILKNEETIPGHRLMIVDAPGISAAAAPGQFLHLRCSDSTDPLLRRPVSIHRVERDKGLTHMLYRVAGRGTTLLAGKMPGEYLDVMGPLGKGFTLPLPGERVAVVGGGIGAAPLFFLVEELIKECPPNNKVAFLLGAASASQLPPAGVLHSPGLEVHTATDDGSAGYHGTVTALLESRINSGPEGFDRIYACGPAPMLRSLVRMAGSLGIPGQVSLEERMGCGVGACLSCACKIKDRSADGFLYKHACTDGPVFDMREVYYES